MSESPTDTANSTEGDARADRDERRAVVVLGMHRSGTSALAGVLHLMGCDAPATPMKPTEANAKGYFESAPIYGMHTELLASAGSRWDDWLPISETWRQSAPAREFVDRAVALLLREFGQSRLFVLKDPRICRLMPFWEDVLDASGVVPSYVLTHRNPLEVAASLAGRDEMDEGAGLLIWLRHVLDAESATRGKTRCFVSYEALLSDWKGTMRRIEEGTGVTLARLTSSVSEQVQDFLEPGLRHHVEPPTQALEDPLLSNWVRETYAILERWSAGAEDTEDFETLDRTRDALDSAATTFAPVVEASRKAHEALAELRTELGETKIALETRDLEADESQREVLAIKAELNDHQRLIVEMRTALAQRQKALDHETEHVATLKRNIGERGAKVAALKLTLQSQYREMAELSRILLDSEERMEAQRDRGDLAEAAADSLRSSTSWRITAPLRWLVRRFRG